MRKNPAFLLLLLAAMAFTAFFYGKALVSPNDYFFGIKGDGLRNYFSYYFHIAHDRSQVESIAMNYPYGENILFTDSQPALSGPLQALQLIFHGISENSIGILNFLMVFSLFLTFLIIYRILILLGTGSWASVLFAFGITVLQPQIFRMDAHFALSYSMAFPLAWLLLLASFKKYRKGKVVFLLGLTNLFWFFVHAYLGLMLAMFQLVLYFIIYFNDKLHKQRAMPHLRFFFAAVIPAAIYGMTVYFTNNHLFRADNPPGFFLYRAEPDDVFIPNHPPLLPWVESLSHVRINQTWEGWGYIGLISGLVMLFVLGLVIFRLFSKKAKPVFDRVFDNPILNMSFLASVIILIFSFGVPYKQFPYLLDIVPGIKQFRAIGRFDWIFFYVASVFSSRLLYKAYRYIQVRGYKIAGWAFMVVAAVFPVFEGLPYHVEMSNKIFRNPNLFDDDHLNIACRDGLKEIDTEDYQALIPLPFYCVGSGVFSRPVQPGIEQYSMVLSAHTGLPVLGQYLTRSSIPESKRIVQIMSPAYYPKKIKEDIHDDRPFLVVASHEERTKYENDLLSRASMIFTSSDFALYRLEKRDLFASTYAAELESFRKIRPKLHQNGEFLSLLPDAFIYFDGFESQISRVVFAGKGAYNGNKPGKNEFAYFEPGTFESSKTYVARAWMYNKYPDALNLWFRFMAEEYDPGQDRWYTTMVLPEYSEVIYGNWSLVELEFTVHDAQNKVWIVSVGKARPQTRLTLDNLLITEKGNDVYRITREGSSPVLFRNGQEIRRY